MVLLDPYQQHRAAGSKLVGGPCLLLLSRLSPRSTLFPYTTLFRSVDRTKPPELGPPPRVSLPPIVTRQLANGLKLMRSEEHTSELQSRVELVCRLLLEKKSSARATMISPEVVKES